MEPAAKRIRPILQALRKAYPQPKIELVFRNAYELLVATILSAQCTDVQVNKVTPELFRRYPDPASLARARRTEVERLIHSTGFFRNKAKSLQGMAQGLTRDFHGRVPRTLAELITLPGVARKTANVVLSGAFGLAEGVVVDTHVQRLSHRLGLTTQVNPAKIEQEMMALVPRAEWIGFGLRLVLHGRRVCMAKKPLCAECPIQIWCPSAFQA